jgi:hypothetical protein
MKAVEDIFFSLLDKQGSNSSVSNDAVVSLEDIFSSFKLNMFIVCRLQVKIVFLVIFDESLYIIQHALHLWILQNNFLIAS